MFGFFVITDIILTKRWSVSNDSWRSSFTLLWLLIFQLLIAIILNKIHPEQPLLRIIFVRCIVKRYYAPKQVVCAALTPIVPPLNICGCWCTPLWTQFSTQIIILFALWFLSFSKYTEFLLIFFVAVFNKETCVHIGLRGLWNSCSGSFRFVRRFITVSIEGKKFICTL